MKQYVTMLPMESGGYRFVEKMNHKFGVLAQIAGDDFKSGELIEWSMNDNYTAEANEWVYIRKERGVIALYNVSDSMDETYTGEYLDPAKRFEMSVKNFVEILFAWEKLRISTPDIILIVIDEDNHVSLEADPRVIKEYQDAGYAFDVNKK